MTLNIITYNMLHKSTRKCASKGCGTVQCTVSAQVTLSVAQTQLSRSPRGINFSIIALNYSILNIMSVKGE